MVTKIDKDVHGDARPTSGRIRTALSRFLNWLLPPVSDAPPKPRGKGILGTFRLIWERYLWSTKESRIHRASAVGLGVFCAIVPVWGFQMLLALLLARVLRLNRALALAASNLSLPPLIPVIVYFALLTGHLLFTGLWDWSAIPYGLTLDAGKLYLKEFLVGSCVLALAAGAAAWIVSYLFLLLLRDPR